FQGSMVDRLRSQAALVLGGAVLVVLATLASRSTWLATLTMAVVGFCVLFAGVVSSVLAAATVSLLLAFILPVSVAAPSSQIPDRLAGWALARAASLLAIVVLLPSPRRDPLRSAAAAACRALGVRLRADAKAALHPSEQSSSERAIAVAQAEATSSKLDTTFLATPYRPTDLSSAARA